MKLAPFVIPICVLFVAVDACADERGGVAPKPLYRDPVFDGAADPVVIWNPRVERWWMFYTNRRANVPDLGGVSWVHGTPIGIAESADGGVTWDYVGTAQIEPPAAAGDEPTFWAPDVIRGHDALWHMFLTVVPGVFNDWGHPRTIYHFTSSDLRNWTDPQPIQLATDRAIDASLLRMPDGTWRMWYNHEPDGKSVYLAESPDLVAWTDRGKVGVGNRCEGPKVFRWRDKYWMVVDQWRGLGVFRSADADAWEAQPGNLLAAPGRGNEDQVQGQHADVLVNDDRAYLFYFTHPGRRGEDAQRDGTEQRRSSIQVVELSIDENGWLACDRDTPTHINLLPPVD